MNLISQPEEYEPISGENTFFLPPTGVSLPEYNSGAVTEIFSLQEGSQVVTLIEVTPQEINGAPPRGQYAQADIALGSAPYELFSLNVNYEPTDLDHSK